MIARELWFYFMKMIIFTTYFISSLTKCWHVPLRFSFWSNTFVVLVCFYPRNCFWRATLFSRVLISVLCTWLLLEHNKSSHDKQILSIYFFIVDSHKSTWYNKVWTVVFGLSKPQQTTVVEKQHKFTFAHETGTYTQYYTPTAPQSYNNISTFDWLIIDYSKLRKKSEDDIKTINKRTTTTRTIKISV